MGQLGWVWFGGRSYKITVFYLTEDNSVFCREDDREPVLLVSQLPKRVNLGFSGSLSVSVPGPPSVFGRNTNSLGPSGTSLSGQTFVLSTVNNQSQWVETGIGNSLDDLREIVGLTDDFTTPASFPGTSHRRTIRAEGSLSSTIPWQGNDQDVGLGFRFAVYPYDLRDRSLLPSGQVILSGYRFFQGPNAPVPNSPLITKLYIDNSSSNPNEAGISIYSELAASASGYYNIIDISNAFGFMARALRSKTVFAVTDGLSRESFVSYRNRITTGTLDSFSTYQIPTIPTLDPDLFTEGDQVLSDEKQPYSIVQDHRSRNHYDNDGNFTQIYLNNTVLANTVAVKNSFTGSQQVIIQIFDKRIHQDLNTTPVASLPTTTIPGLPANTKAVLGVLACPL